MTIRNLLPTSNAKMRANIRTVWEAATPEERAMGARWYMDAHDHARNMARRYHVPFPTTVAVISALSPSNLWSQNLKDAAAFLEAFTRGDKDRPLAQTYGPNADKAWNILQDGEADPLGYFEGRAHKTRAFYLSILEPGRTQGIVVVDGHALNVALGRRVPLSEVPNLSAMGRYFPVSDAYVHVADDLGIVASTLQATTWLAWRRMHEVSDPSPATDHTYTGLPF